MPFLLFPFPKKKLDQTPTACALLRHEREGRGEGKVKITEIMEKEGVYV
jgi:hypothetical protein